MGASLSIERMVCRLGGRTILDGIDLSLAAGEVVALLGASGCGKSTLLKLVAGMLEPDGGAVRIGARTVAAPGECLPPEARELGMVFQDYALWPHLTVGDNVGFPLAVRGVGRSVRRKRVADALARVDLAGFEGRSPAALSGGQQQRVALARAIVVEPGLLLFDEPLSNLDRELRESLCGQIAGLLREIGSTAIYVTHDHEEAMRVADRVAVMSEGRILQIDTPVQLVEAPANLAVARFLKLGNLLPGHIDAAGGLVLDGMRLPASESAHWRGHRGEGHLLMPFTALSTDGARAVGAGPGSDRPASPGAIDVVVVAQHYRGGFFDTTVRPVRGDTTWRWMTPLALAGGRTVSLQPDVARLRWYAA